MPRSPWLASAGCTKNEGVPVEASVAAILRPICPDLPMPDTISRPRDLRTVSTAVAKASPSAPRIAAEIAATPPASASSVRSAESRAAGRYFSRRVLLPIKWRLHLCATTTPVDRHHDGSAALIPRLG